MFRKRQRKQQEQQQYEDVAPELPVDVPSSDIPALPEETPLADAEGTAPPAPTPAPLYAARTVAEEPDESLGDMEEALAEFDRPAPQEQASEQPKLQPQAAEPEMLQDGGGKVISVIEQMESQLNALRDAESRREEHEARLDAREAELKALEETLQSRDRELAELLTGAQDKQEKLEATRSELKQEAERLAQQRADNDAQMEQVEARMREVEERTASAEARDGETEARLETLQSLEKEIEGRRGEIDARHESIEQRAAEIDARSESIETRLREMSERESAQESRDSELGARQAEIEERLAAVEQREQQASELTAQADAVEQRRREAEDLANQARGAEAHGAELAQEAESRQQALEGRAAELEQQAQHLEQRAQEATQREERLAGLRLEIDEQQQEMERREGELALLRKELDQRLEFDSSDDSEKVAALESQATELRQQVEQLSAAASKAQAQAATERESTQGLHERIATLESELDEVLSATISQAPEFGTRDEAFNALRKQRLSRYKEMLRAKAAKLYRIKEALQDKQKEVAVREQSACSKMEEVRQADHLRQQAEQLAFEVREEADAVEQMRRKVELRAVRAKSSVFVSSIALALVGLGALTWFLTGQFVNPVYIATSTLAIDERDVEPTSGDMADWRGFVMSLPADPQFLERASSRLRARGYDEMGTPTDLREELSKRLDVSSNNADRVTLEMRGPGAGRTERALDTLTTAVVAYANDTRELRADQSSTRVADRADADRQPVVDGRPKIFAIAFGAAGLGLLIAAFSAWMSLRRVVLSQLEDDVPAGPMDSPVGDTDAGLMQV
ncbi:MAG: hypothetical protein AAFX05_03725 [Planctomycetota bacterium]